MKSNEIEKSPAIDPMYLKNLVYNKIALQTSREKNGLFQQAGKIKRNFYLRHFS